MLNNMKIYFWALDCWLLTQSMYIVLESCLNKFLTEDLLLHSIYQQKDAWDSLIFCLNTVDLFGQVMK